MIYYFELKPNVIQTPPQDRGSPRPLEFLVQAIADYPFEAGILAIVGFVAIVVTFVILLKLWQPWAAQSMRAMCYFVTTVILSGCLLGLILVGILVNSQPYRDSLLRVMSNASDHNAWDVIHIWIMVIATYTLTNACLLAVVASLLGALASRVNIGPDTENYRPVDATHPWTSAVLRGVLLYLLLLAGVLIASDTEFTFTQAEYCKTAGFVSAAAFVTGMSPDSMRKLLDSAGSVFASKDKINRFQGTETTARAGSDLNSMFRNLELAEQKAKIKLMTDGGTIDEVELDITAAGSGSREWRVQAAKDSVIRLTHPSSADHTVTVIG